MKRVEFWYDMDSDKPSSYSNEATADELLSAAAESVGAAAESGVRMRLLGGIAVFQLAPSSRASPLARSYHDFDVVVPSRAGATTARVLRSLGYGEDPHFNALHGAQRMIFTSARGFVVDVLVGTFQMCHRLELGRDLPEVGLTVHPADLLLTKLQIVELEEKDLRDAVALLIDLPLAGTGSGGIDPERFVRPLAEDWGFYHTVEQNLPKVVEYATTHLDGARANRTARAVQLLEAAMLGRPKSLKWKMRARVGEKLSWYEMPEET